MFTVSLSPRQILMFSVLLLFFAANAPRRNQTHAAQNPIVPPPPVARADRFGIYNWNVNDSAFPATGATDRLNWGANKVAELGSRTIRVAISTRDDYRVNPPGNPDLVDIAKSPAYDKLFRDARFQTYMLTAYPRGSADGNWADGYSQAESDAERDEIKRFGEYLLGNAAFAGKTFILLNWEGDNAIFFYANKSSIWDGFTNWIRARVEGVKLARQTNPSSAARLYSGLEFSAVRSPLTNRPCGERVNDPVNADPLQNRCLIDYVAPQVEVDYYSYSSWQTVNQKEPDANLSLKQVYKRDLDFALAKIKAQRPDVTESNFIIGEYGFERSRYGECYAASNLNEMFDAFDGAGAFRVSYVVFWQVIDNGRLFGHLDERFGLFRADGQTLKSTMLSESFQKRMAGQQVAAYTGCPRIRRSPEPPGVLNQQGTTEFKLNPDTIGSIYASNTGAPFSASGNTVHFNQFARRFRIPADAAANFFESPAQINFSMPPARRPGYAWIYVSDSRGFESNASTIFIACDDCPQFAPACAVLDSTYQTLRIEPGATVTLNGSKFSPSGNTIIIEQFETQQTNRRWTLPRGDVLSESSAQINVRLPNDLSPGDALIHVVNAQGLGSAETIVPISSPCQNCGPRLKPCAGIVNEAGGDFAAGTVATVFGRFAPSGNKVIIEQFDQSGTLYRQTVSQGAAGWDESDRRIRFALPFALFPGRALIYVANAQGKESRAQAILVKPTPVTGVSAANYRGPSLAGESIVAAFGTALAKTTQAAASTPLPAELAGTQVLIKDSAGVERPAPIFFVSPTQVNFQVPAGTAMGAASINIKNGFGSASPGTAQIARIAPGLFSATANGKGLAAAVALRVRGDGSQSFEAVVGRDPATGQPIPLAIDLGPASDQVFLILFGSGVRGRTALSAVTAAIGGANAEVGFAGAHPTLVGVDQINLRIPRTLAGRGDVEVTVTVEDKAANPLQVRIK
ncbi:MAG: hypothetical protein ACREEM_10580 [Blastocatellia bacterium]